MTPQMKGWNTNRTTARIMITCRAGTTNNDNKRHGTYMLQELPDGRHHRQSLCGALIKMDLTTF